MWLACYTQEEIAEAVGTGEEAVRLITQKSADLPELGKSEQALASHAADFEPMFYNIWKQQTVDAFGAEWHLGRPGLK
jgi:hypothetical protein